MTASRIAISLTVLLALTACVTAKESHLKDGYRLLSGEEIRALHQNKTHEVKLASGMTVTDYFSADGRSSFARSDGVRDVGIWEIRSHHVCYLYPKIPDTQHNCFSLAEKDGRYVLFKEFFDKKGAFGGAVISITPGNAKNLPLE